MTDQTIAAAPAAAPALRHPKANGSLNITLKNLWPYIWPHDRADLRTRVFLALAMMLLGKFVTVAVPYAFKWATDALTANNLPSASAWTWLMAAPIALTMLYGLLRVIMALLTQLRDALFAAVAMNAVRRLALDVFVHLHQLSLRYHLERKTGGLTRILERGRAAIETIVRMIMLTGVPTAVEFLLYIAVFLIQFDWRYAVIVILTVVAYMWFTTSASNWRIAIRKLMNESDTDANTKAIDSLLNYETVKYFGAEQREQARYDVSMEKFERMSVRTYTSLAVLNFGQALILAIGWTLMMVLCVVDIRAGRNTAGDFVMVNAMMIQLSFPLNFMGMVYREVKQAVTDIEMMFDILDKNPEIQDRPGAQPLKVAQGAVKFEDVVFSYDPARAILKGISFEIPAGKTLAVVGPSGAGKSTLSRLLFRFYEPQSGRILVDGQDIAMIQQASLRENIGMVPQDTVLFNDTIGYNIRYGRWSATPEEVQEAARLAQIDRFIHTVPGGYEAQVGERGLKLSGGEKQRVAIARTILKAPPILVLDEATSALDSFTEREIQVALDGVSKNRTTLVIAHRLSTVVNADEIIVLDKGVIVERGSHEALLGQGGVYAAMWNRQREVDQAQEAIRRAAEAEGRSVRVNIGAG